MKVFKVQYPYYDEIIDGGANLNSEKKKKDKFQIQEDKGPEIVYLTNVADIFPVDIDIERHSAVPFLQRLRPEFLINYTKPLNADTFSGVGGVEPEKDEIEVAEAGKFLRSVGVKTLLKNLESLDLLPVCSETLTQVIRLY